MEMLVVIIIIGIIAVIAIAVYSGAQARARDSTRKQQIRDIAKALTLYELENNSYIESASGCGV